MVVTGSPPIADIADNLTSKLITLPGILVIAVLLGFVFRPTFHPVPWAIAVFVPAILLAFVVRFFAEWTLALGAALLIMSRAFWRVGVRRYSSASS